MRGVGMDRGGIGGVGRGYGGRGGGRGGYRGGMGAADHSQEKQVRSDFVLCVCWVTNFHG